MKAEYEVARSTERLYTIHKNVPHAGCVLWPLWLCVRAGILILGSCALLLLLLGGRWDGWLVWGGGPHHRTFRASTTNPFPTLVGLPSAPSLMVIR